MNWTLPQQLYLLSYDLDKDKLGPVAFSNPVAYPAAGSLVSSIIAEGETPTDPVIPVELAARIIDRTDLPDELRAAAHERLAQLADAPVHEPGETVRGTHDYVIEFTACTDGQWTQGLDYWQEFNERTAEVAPLTAQLGLLVTPTCAFWPTDAKMPPLDDSFPETIVAAGKPLPLEQSTYESWTPLDENAEHATDVPRFTDPTIPAERER